jgi:hypothetical protein
MARLKKLTYYSIQVSGQNTPYHFYRYRTISSTRRLIDKLVRKDPTISIDITRHSHWFRYNESGVPKLIRTMETKFLKVRVKKGKPKIIPWTRKFR